MTTTLKSLLAIAATLAASPTLLPALEVQSPNAQLVLNFEVKSFEGANGCPVYRVSWRGKPIVTDSRLGLDLEPAPMDAGFEVVRQTASAHDSTWKPVYGERSSIRDHYNELVVQLRETEAPRRILNLTFRAYDEGIAFCYTIPQQPGLSSVSLRREQTEFRFLADHDAWAVYSAQGKYAKVPLSQIKAGCERPLTIQAGADSFIALAEARLVDFARMKLAPLKDRPHSLVSDLSSAVTNALPLKTPWRVVMAATSPGRLLENNDLIFNLNDPCALADTSWIKPGKVIREVTLTTAGGKACVDFAVKRGLQYIEFDAGWYGHEYDDKSDARAVNLDPKRSKGPLDLAEVIRYANERGVGVWLYVNRRALEKQLDELLPLYRRWGVKGVKYGFVNVGSQRWTAWLHDAIRKAAEHQLMVDVHDEYRPTGYARTYPNLLTQEGIAGDETSPPNDLTLTILFSRMLAGPADNTICYYDRRVDANASHAYQLAKAVCLYSPLQFLYWYDRPPASPQKVGGAGNAETNTSEDPELAFWDAMPTVWDDTKVLHGKIGEYAVIARRSGADWFVGAMNNATARTLETPLSFLEPGRKYTAHVYADDPTLPSRTRVRLIRQQVTRETVLSLALPAKGGQALRIVPQN